MTALRRGLAVLLVVLAAFPTGAASARKSAPSPCPLNVVPRDPGWTSIQAPEFTIHPQGHPLPKNQPGAGFFAVPEGHPNRIFMASADELYRSDNGGCSWKLLSLGAQQPLAGISDIDVTPDGNTVYVQAWPANFPSVSTLVYISNDGGDTWRDATRDNPSLISGDGDLVLAPSDPRTVYVMRGDSFVGGHALFRSADAGATWESVTAPGLPDIPKGGTLAVSSQDPNELWGILDHADEKGAAKFLLGHSADGGRTWNLVPDAPSWPGSIPTLVVGGKPGQPPRIAMSGRTDVSVSLDGGKTWNDAGWPPSAPEALTYLAFGRNADTLFEVGGEDLVVAADLVRKTSRVIKSRSYATNGVRDSFGWVLEPPSYVPGGGLFLLGDCNTNSANGAWNGVGCFQLYRYTGRGT